MSAYVADKSTVGACMPGPGSERDKWKETSCLIRDKVDRYLGVATHCVCLKDAANIPGYVLKEVLSCVVGRGNQGGLVTTDKLLL